jgi:hypothetical protein
MVRRGTAKESPWAREIVSLIARAVAAAAITASRASDHAETCGRFPVADSLAMG